MTTLDIDVVRLLEADDAVPPIEVEPFDMEAEETAQLRFGRLETMLDDENYILPSLTEPNRQAPEGAAAGTFLDGSTIQFLDELGPFPEGLGPHALAYEHAMRAYVLQEYSGQRHVQHSIPYIRIQPARNLRDWSISTYEQGRQLEAEALGIDAPPRSVDGRQQAQLERISAGYAPGSEVRYPALLRRAIAMYERSSTLAEPAARRFERHLELHPEAAGVFRSTIDLLDLNRLILDADIGFARLSLAEATPDRETLVQLLELYQQADAEALRYIMRYHIDPAVLPPGALNTDLSGLPREDQEQVYAAQQDLRDRSRNTGRFAGERVMDEFDGIRTRLNTRIALLQRSLTAVR